MFKRETDSGLSISLPIVLPIMFVGSSTCLAIFDQEGCDMNQLNSTPLTAKRPINVNVQWQLPKWLHIAKVGDEHYRVIDTSVDSVGFHLGSFQTRQAAQRFAMKVSEARAEVRNRNLSKLRPQ
jgi:hypothetical protein